MHGNSFDQYDKNVTLRTLAAEYSRKKIYLNMDAWHLYMHRLDGEWRATSVESKVLSTQANLPTASSPSRAPSLNTNFCGVSHGQPTLNIASIVYAKYCFSSLSCPQGDESQPRKRPSRGPNSKPSSKSDPCSSDGIISTKL